MLETFRFIFIYVICVLCAYVGMWACCVCTAVAFFKIQFLVQKKFRISLFQILARPYGPFRSAGSILCYI